MGSSESIKQILLRIESHIKDEEVRRINELRLDEYHKEIQERIDNESIWKDLEKDVYST